MTNRYANKSNAVRAIVTLGCTDRKLAATLVEYDGDAHQYLVDTAKVAAAIAPVEQVSWQDVLDHAATLPEVAEPVVSKVSRPTLKGVPMRRASTMPGAVAKAHELFGSYAEQAGENMTRKGAIAYAVEQGIAFFTARTQYQRWSHAFG